MVNGDIPPLLCAFGSLGPRGPCCIPLSTSSKPIVLSSRVPSPTEKITARYDGYKARATATAAPPPFDRHRTRKSATNLKDLKRGQGGVILDRPVGVAGAGSIGGFVGGMCVAAGRRVALLARPRVIQEIEGNGLRLTSFEGLDRQVAAKQLTLSADPPVFGDAGVVLGTVKSADTAEIADLIARHAPADAVIVSLQNGIGNVSVLRARLPGRRVLGGMVPFNVIALGEGRFHRATSGDIVIEQDDAAIADQLSVPGLRMRATPNIAGVQWGKLLVNLNNALHAGGRCAAASTAGAPRGAHAARGPDGGGISSDQGRGHQADLIDAGPGGLDAAFAAAARRRVWHTAGADHEDRSRGALIDVGRPAARPPHRDRLSAGRHHRDRRPARAASAAVAPHRCADQERRGRRQRLAQADAGAYPAVKSQVACNCLEKAMIKNDFGSSGHAHRVRPRRGGTI